MNLFSHILVPVDFGEADSAAIDLAVRAAQANDARLTLVHAFDPMVFDTGAVYPTVLDLGPALDAAEGQVSKLRDETLARWAKTDALVEQGNVNDAILRVATDKGCDLIVMGTHGRRGLARAFLGSVAEKVVRLATVPVLTVHPPSASPSSKRAA